MLKDCDDVSDEKNCRTIAIDPEKYLKSKPPPSLKAGTKLPITLRYLYKTSLLCGGLLSKILSKIFVAMLLKARVVYFSFHRIFKVIKVALQELLKRRFFKHYDVWGTHSPPAMSHQLQHHTACKYTLPVIPHNL